MTEPRPPTIDVVALESLTARFWAWRRDEAPRTRDDLPRIDRVAGWAPRWRAIDVERYRAELAGFEHEQGRLVVPLAAVGEHERGDYVDLRLLASALARARIELDVLAPWRVDPWFYLDQTIGTIYDLLLLRPPFDEARAVELVGLLESFDATVSAGIENGRGALARELALVALEVAPRAGAQLREALALLSPVLPAAGRDAVARASAPAAEALERYAAFLDRELDRARSLNGVGAEVFARITREVALIPYTADQLLAIGRQEWDRSVAFEIFEAHRVPDARWPEPPASAPEQCAREHRAEADVRGFYEARHLLGQPATLRHYLNVPRPPWIEPIAWLGVSDDLTSPERLDQDAISYVPVPSPDLPYFYRANAADPRAGIVHEGAHYQQLALSWRHERPARRHFYDSAPNEGIALYNEEMLTQAGLFDEAPLTRRIIYNFMRLRALRVECDVEIARGALTIDAAADLLATKVPMDTETARAEAAFFAATPTQGMSYTIGKFQLQRLLADARTVEGEAFSLLEFHNWIWRNGNVPFALLRFERLGDRSDLERIDALSRG